MTMPALRPNRRSWAAVLVAVLVVATTASVPAAAAEPPSNQPGLTVTLHEDGSAVVTVQLTYDLTTAAERDAFRSLRNDTALTDDAKERYRDRMERVAADVHRVTGRNVRVTDPAVAFDTTADTETGIVELSVTMDGLVEQRGDALVLEEPFASGFEPDRPLRVRGPDGYTISTATPDPTTVQDGLATWSADTDLEGFSVVVTPVESAGAPTDGGSANATPETESTGQPGFGFVTLGLVVVLLGGFFHRRERR